MLNETYRAMLNNKSVIRETFMYGRQRDLHVWQTARCPDRQ